MMRFEVALRDENNEYTLKISQMGQAVSLVLQPPSQHNDRSHKVAQS